MIDPSDARGELDAEVVRGAVAGIDVAGAAKSKIVSCGVIAADALEPLPVPTLLVAATVNV